MGMTKDVSIVIVNYNTYQLLESCVRSVIDYSKDIDYEIIVVDNGSDPELSSKLDSVFPNQVRTVLLTENVGFGRANNAGIDVACGRYVFFLNPDTVLLNNAIKILCDYMDSHPTVGVCGGNLYDADMKPTHSFRMLLPSIWWEIDYHLGYFFGKLLWGKNLEFNYTETPRPVGYITGADMMVRKDILDNVGRFSKHFFMYYEECELTYRVRKSGYKVFSVPTARIQHLEGKSFLSSELTSKAKYQIYSRWMYRRLCSPYYIYKLLSVYTNLKRRISNHKDPVLDYQCEVINQIENSVK